MKRPTKRALVVALAALYPLSVYALPPGLRYDDSNIPAPAVGHSTDKVSNNPGDPPTQGGCAGTEVGDCGAQRVTCAPSHKGPDDPILNPMGTVEGSHLHVFWGSVGTDGDTDIDADPQVTGLNSTCRGGTVNRSLYWAPEMIDVRTGEPLTFRIALIYYKHEHVNLVPVDFRFIFGALTTSTTPASQSIVKFNCVGGSSPDSTFRSSLNQVVCNPGSEVWRYNIAPTCLSMDGVTPYGGLSGAYVDWRWRTIGPQAGSAVVTYTSRTIKANVATLPTSGAGGAAAPSVVTTIEGSSTLVERAEVTFNALTAGQSVTVAGLTYTSTGDTTAEEVAKAFIGGTPDFDSPDHRSHTAVRISTGQNTGACPDSHPYEIPAITYVLKYEVTDADMTKHIRLAVDDYSGPSGYREHGDWRMGWKPNEMRAWILGLNRLARDGHAHLRGDRDENNNLVNSPKGRQYTN